MEGRGGGAGGSGGRKRKRPKRAPAHVLKALREIFEAMGKEEEGHMKEEWEGQVTEFRWVWGRGFPGGRPHGREGRGGAYGPVRVQLVRGRAGEAHAHVLKALRGLLEPAGKGDDGRPKEE